MWFNYSHISKINFIVRGMWPLPSVGLSSLTVLSKAMSGWRRPHTGQL